MPLLIQTLGAGSDHAFSGDAVALLIILGVAGLVGLMMAYVRLPVVPAYLIAGVIIGPAAAGLVDTDQIKVISRLAIILLMFGIGLHLDLGALKGSVGRLLTVAAASIALSVALLWPLALLLGIGWAGALTLAMALSLSSTAVVLRLLHESRRLTQAGGRLALSILIAQDLAVILILMALPLLATLEAGGDNADRFNLVDILLGALRAGGSAAAIVLVGRVVLPHLLGSAAARRAGELLMVVALAFALGAAVLTEVAELSAELGAFLAGLMLASTPFRHHLSGQIGPMRDLFIAVFFTALGTKLDLEVVLDALPLVLTATVVLLTVKTACISLTAWAGGATPALAITAGLWLAQGGEFGLVIIGVAVGLGLVDGDTESIVTAVIIVSLILTPLLFALAPRAAKRAAGAGLAPWQRSASLGDVPVDRPEHAHETDGHASPSVIVAGLGVVGRAVVERLRKLGLSVTVIEMNPATVRKQTTLGLTMVYGDAANHEVLEQAGASHARALILTVPDEQAVLRAVQTARAMNPSLYIIARTNYLSRGMMAKTLGANEYIVEEIVTAEAMEALVEQALATTRSTSRNTTTPDTPTTE